MRMSTLASFKGYEIWRDMSGNILMNGVQYDSPMDAAWAAPDELRREMIKQVYETQLNYIDGPAAYDAAKKLMDDDEGFKDSTTSDIITEGPTDEGR